jgi:hypothetical protein
VDEDEDEDEDVDEDVEWGGTTSITHLVTLVSLGLI